MGWIFLNEHEWNRLLFRTLLLCIIGFVSTCQGEQRTWTDAKNQTIDAELVTCDGKTVTLKKADGKTVEVNLERLSKEDQGFILNNPRTGLGIKFVELSDPQVIKVLKQYNAVPPVKDGIYVTEILPKTPASESGLHAGDIIAMFEGKPVRRVGMGYLDLAKEYEIVAYRSHEKESTAAKKPSKAPTKRTKTPARASAPTKKDWEKLTFSVKVLSIRRLKEIEEKVCPISIEGASLGENAIGTPRITVTVKNGSSQPVIAFKLSIESFDKFGDPVKKFRISDNEVVGMSQDTIAPGKEDKSTWDLHGQDTAAKFKIAVVRVKMEDGSEWVPTSGFEETFNTK